MCRELVAAGYDPATPLEAYRGDMLCLRVRSIGEGAKYTVKDNSTGTPALRRYQEPVLGIARASSIAPDVSGALQRSPTSRTRHRRSGHKMAARHFM